MASLIAPTVGKILFLASGLFFIYVFLWLAVSPTLIIGPDNPLNLLFPAPEHGFMLFTQCGFWITTLVIGCVLYQMQQVKSVV